MHKKLVANIISRMFLIVSVFMMLPLGWAVHDNYYSREVMAFVVTILIGILLSCLTRWIFRAKKEDFNKLNAKDGLAVVGLSWIVLSAFGALPFYLANVVPSYTDAFFETVSGFTTTGASIMTDIEILPRGILFWRSLTHWLGGMGIIVLYLALLPILGQSAFQLYKAETSGITAEKALPRIKETATILWSVYFLFTLIQVLLHLLGDMPLFDALCQSFGAIATGGFSTKNASIAAFNAYHQWVIIIFMFLGGINFMLHYQALRGRLGEVFRAQEFRVYFLILFCLIPFFTFYLANGGGAGNPLRDAAFQVVSIMTATGYATADFDLWPNALKSILLVLMFVGGCAGSTAGGFKVIRLIVVVKVAFNSVVRAIFPRIVLPVRIDKDPLSEQLTMEVVSFFILYILFLSGGTIVMTILESCDLVTAFSANLSLLSNVGPGLGLVGAARNYAWISIPGKWVLSFLMLAGRLELYAILILLSPMTWKK